MESFVIVARLVDLVTVGDADLRVVNQGRRGKDAGRAADIDLRRGIAAGLGRGVSDGDLLTGQCSVDGRGVHEWLED